MFKRFTDRLNAAFGNGDEAAAVDRLVAMGFDATSARQALQACNDNVEQAAELLLLSTTTSSSTESVAGTTTGNRSNTTPTPPPRTTNHHHRAAAEESEDELLQRVMQESLQTEQRRQARTASAAMSRAAQAAERRAEAYRDARTLNKKPTTTTTTGSSAPSSSNSSFSDTFDNTNTLVTPTGLAVTHPAVKLVPQLQDKTKEEQVLRCADRLKAYPKAVDTLYRALTAVQKDPDNFKFRNIDKQTPGYQKTCATAPGAEDLLRAMNFYPSSNNTALRLDRAAVDPALLFLGISALEQAKQSTEYQLEKARLLYHQQMHDTLEQANASEAEAVQRAAFISKCPSEPPDGRGALVHVVLTSETTVRRRFDGDDTLLDVLHWLGGHGTTIWDKLQSGEWRLVDVNQYPERPLDCSKQQQHTLQYLGCWPSGRLAIQPNPKITTPSTTSSTTTTTNPDTKQPAIVANAAM